MDRDFGNRILCKSRIPEQRTAENWSNTTIEQCRWIDESANPKGVMDSEYSVHTLPSPGSPVHFVRRMLYIPRCCWLEAGAQASSQHCMCSVYSVCSICIRTPYNDSVAWQSRIRMKEPWLSTRPAISKGRELRSTYSTEKRHCTACSFVTPLMRSTTVVLAASGHSSVVGGARDWDGYVCG